MAKDSTPLKDKNAVPLWSFLGLNVSVFLVVMLYGQLSFSSFEQFWTKLTDPRGIAALGIPVLVVVLNGLLPAGWKERLVFLRWRHPLPGSRVFTAGRGKDARIDWKALEAAHGPFPEDADAQNALWYRLYRQQRDVESVSNAHRVYLLTRDMTGFCFLLFCGFGIAAFAFLNWKAASLYAAFLFCQWFVIRWSAYNYGWRFTFDALAEASHAG